MLAIENSNLEVVILHPDHDIDFLGTRYCHGGSIFQVIDKSRSFSAKLLSGPTFPDTYDPLHGQGIPDSFEHCPIYIDNKLKHVLGIGICDNGIVEPVNWKIILKKDNALFSTIHRIGSETIELKRSISLFNRSLNIETIIENKTSEHITITWYPHPFFPQPRKVELCRIFSNVDWLDNPFYEFVNNGYICRKANQPVNRAFFALDHKANSPVALAMRHDTCGQVLFESDYVPGFFPIWGNQRTFSMEPYFQTRIARTRKTVWNVSLHF